MVKTMIQRYIVCDSRPLSSPIVPDLPAKQVSEAPPFGTNRIDFAGSLYIHNSNSKECNYGLTFYLRLNQGAASNIKSSNSWQHHFR